VSERVAATEYSSWFEAHSGLSLPYGNTTVSIIGGNISSETKSFKKTKSNYRTFLERYKYKFIEYKYEFFKF
jgi:hypothetical protein